MSTHIYAFGSICRGEVSPSSDIDLLAIVSGHDSRFTTRDYSIYSIERIRTIWAEGNPFAWHLHLEARLLHSSTGSDLLDEMGRPADYSKCQIDCLKFFNLFKKSRSSIESDTTCAIFDLATIFLAIRNFATCYSLTSDRPTFSRHSALQLEELSIPIPQGTYLLLERARILSTRGIGELLSEDDLRAPFKYFDVIERWMTDLLRRIN